MMDATTVAGQDVSLNIDMALMRKRLLMMRTNLQRQLDSQRRARWEIPDDDEDSDDADRFEPRERVRSFGRTGATRQKMAEVENALRKMDAGRYGLCESCGGTIVKARLLATPFARHCAVCPERTCR